MSIRRIVNSTPVPVNDTTTLVTQYVKSRYEHLLKLSWSSTPFDESRSAYCQNPIVLTQLRYVLY